MKYTSDRETVVTNEIGLTTTINWESQFLKQTISYIYDGNLLQEERIVQLDKLTGDVKIASCVCLDNGNSTITVIDGSDVEIREVENNV
ncbi:hypothetical protein [Trichormus sp. NMC-1]|uniref:hypothetical protein n=1 Tax=Trichormus sp. NMC-1 TaxID=1853259 RepID=UPI0008DBF98C|nr:hypothetical protein [Trichormus sp. NMC-1]